MTFVDKSITKQNTVVDSFVLFKEKVGMILSIITNLVTATSKQYSPTFWQYKPCNIPDHYQVTLITSFCSKGLLPLSNGRRQLTDMIFIPIPNWFKFHKKITYVKYRSFELLLSEKSNGHIQMIKEIKHSLFLSFFQQSFCYLPLFF